jgi:hypothetical protein
VIRDKTRETIPNRPGQEMITPDSAMSKNRCGSKTYVSLGTSTCQKGAVHTDGVVGVSPCDVHEAWAMPNVGLELSCLAPATRPFDVNIAAGEEDERSQRMRGGGTLRCPRAECGFDVDRIVEPYDSQIQAASLTLTIN